MERRPLAPVVLRHQRRRPCPAVQRSPSPRLVDHMRGRRLVQHLGVAQHRLFLPAAPLALGGLHRHAPRPPSRCGRRASSGSTLVVPKLMVEDVEEAGSSSMIVLAPARPRRSRGRQWARARCRDRRPACARASRRAALAAPTAARPRPGSPPSSRRHQAPARSTGTTGTMRSVPRSRPHHHVPVAALPRRHRIARDGVHLHVDHQQIACTPPPRAAPPGPGVARRSACPAAGPACPR